jgi:xanthine dehydrogenase accessory factor
LDTGRPLVIIRGGGDLGTGVALRLHRAGWQVLITELARPMVIRRAVAFASAIYDGSIEVENVIARRLERDVLPSKAQDLWASEQIPVIVDPGCSIAARMPPHAIVDAIMVKRNSGTHITDAPIVIALGPGFTAGVDCHAVIETQRGHNLGRVHYQGSADADTGTPGNLGGQDSQRVVRVPIDGVFYAHRQIGDQVKAGDMLGRVLTVDVSLTDSAARRLAVTDRDASQPLGTIVKTRIDGVVRGILHDGLVVLARTKVADVDPRGVVRNCFTVSDKAWAVGGGVLEAVMYLSRQSRISPP